MLFLLETTPCETKVDLCFIIDSSGSIRDSNPPGVDNWQLQLNFLATLVDAFQIGQDHTRVGAVSFSDIVLLEFKLSDYDDAASAKDAILNIDYIGQTTNTAGGFRVTREQCFNLANGDRPDVQNMAVIITDGQPFPLDTVPVAREEARRLQGAGVTMISIGVTDVINVDLLKQFSSPPQTEGSNYFTALEFTDLESIRSNVKEETCVVLEGKIMPTSALHTYAEHVDCTVTSFPCFHLDHFDYKFQTFGHHVHSLGFIATYNLFPSPLLLPFSPVDVYRKMFSESTLCMKCMLHLHFLTVACLTDFCSPGFGGKQQFFLRFSTYLLLCCCMSFTCKLYFHLFAPLTRTTCTKRHFHSMLHVLNEL